MNTLERLDAWLSLPEEERMLLASVQTLARTQIAPRAEHYDRAAEFPWDNVKAINALGLNAMFIPEAYGGAIVVFRARRDLCAGESLHAREEHALRFGQRKPGVQTFKSVHAITVPFGIGIACSSILELGFALFHECAHAFDRILGLERERVQVRLDIQPFVQRHVERALDRVTRQAQRRQAEAAESAREPDCGLDRIAVDDAVYQP